MSWSRLADEGPRSANPWFRRAIPFRTSLSTLVVAMVLGALSAQVVLANPAGAQAKGWTMTSLHVVGGPTLAGGNVIVFNVTPTHLLQLSALSPSTGRQVWTESSSASAITPGVAFAPVSINGVVVNLSPYAGTDSALVAVQGVEATTGKVLWQVPTPSFALDAPVACTPSQFCVAVQAQAGVQLWVIAATTGKLARKVAGIERNLGVAQMGQEDQATLWQTTDPAPTVLQLSATGQPLWRKTVAQLFGGPSYTPDYGWDFISADGLDIGTVGQKSSNSEVVPLGGFKTIGVSAATGDVKWSLPGAYDCTGSLQFLSANVLCSFKGSERVGPGNSPDFTGAQLQLQGLSVPAGRVTWSHEVGDPGPIATGSSVAFLDGQHLVVEIGGRRQVLDAASGAVQPPAPGEVFWCEHVALFRVVAMKELSARYAERAAEPVFGGCSAGGAALASLPRTRPPAVGVSTAGLFIWASPTGLEAVPSGS